MKNKKKGKGTKKVVRREGRKRRNCSQSIVCPKR